MENLKATTYRGYSQVSGDIALTQLIEFMRGNTYREPITRIREAPGTGRLRQGGPHQAAAPPTSPSPPTTLNDDCPTACWHTTTSFCWTSTTCLPKNCHGCAAP